MHTFDSDIARWFTATDLAGTLLFFAGAGTAWEWAKRLGGPGLVLLGIFDNTPFISAPPGSMDLAVILLSAHQSNGWAYFALMASIGEVMGGYTTYRISEKGGQETLERKLGPQRAKKLYDLFARHGAIAIFVGAILPPPFPFTSVVMTAGVLQYPRKQFFSVLSAGRTLRFLIVAWFARIYSQPMIDFFTRHYRALVLILIVLAVGAAVAELFYYLRRRAKRGMKTASGIQTSRQELKP